jgi:hypothetical protein
MSLDYLVGGAVYGASLAFVSIAIPSATRHILATVLAVAALAYVPFAIAADGGVAWVAVELAGACIFSYAAMRGLRGSAWWLVAGFALHPVWDVALHLAGAGRIAPEWYTTSCLTYDIAVAGIAAIAILIGTHLTDAPARTRARAIALPLRPSTCTCTTCTYTTCCTMGACAA